MKYEILIEDYFSQKQIHVLISGQMTKKSRNEAIIETIKMMRKEDISNVIWDIREVHLEYSLIESHLIIEQLNEFAIKLTDHVAVVYRNNENQHNRANNVAHNRNRNINYYKDNIEEARKWLYQFNATESGLPLIPD
jgi:hypothetical protein